MNSMAGLTIAALALAFLASVFALWPIVADAPWENDSPPEDTLEENVSPPEDVNSDATRCDEALALLTDASVLIGKITPSPPSSRSLIPRARDLIPSGRNLIPSASDLLGDVGFSSRGISQQEVDELDDLMLRAERDIRQYC